MLHYGLLVLFASLAIPAFSQTDGDGPKDEKAKKTFTQALEYERQHRPGAALDTFKKADKQDAGHCLACQEKMIQHGIDIQDWKTALAAAEEMVAEAQSKRAVALAHYWFGIVLMKQALDKHKDDLLAQAHAEMAQALTTAPNFPEAVYADGQILAHLKQDAAAKAQFERFVKMGPPNDATRQRALRYISQPELARARMAPPFVITTSDGQRLSLDGLQGKVVLLDFWATWCGPCREALPHMRQIAKKFQGQPLVVLSVNLDEDEKKWKDFVAKNGMLWPQYRDGSFDGPIATTFRVRAIPQTFTIDADGVLQDQHIGDASIEGKLKKLVNQARESQTQETPKQ
jgi:thiol-disulfide isomerase/thioredoxin